MGDYPLLKEYKQAILFAEDNFKELTHLRPVLDEDGAPVMSSGNFAVVIKMKDEQTGKLHAVKCFLKEQEGRAEAYRMIAEELEYVNSTFLTPIKYLEKELFVDTAQTDETEFPVLLMDWVEGITLDKYIREHIDDQYELSLLAYQFSRLAMWLMPQPFAHGDLKPDNILVKGDGTLVLVDYDGMYVPAMKGQKARELGSPDYRLPSRTEDNFDEHIDDFALVLIMLTIRAIQLDKTLFEEFGKNDFSILHENDLRNLANSVINQKLLCLISDSELARLYSLLLMIISDRKLSKRVVGSLMDSVFCLIEQDFRFYRAKKLCNVGKASKEELRGAYRIFDQLSAEQHIEAQVCMSCCLRNGYGCAKNVEKGVELLQSCARIGNSRAQCSLGQLYEIGKYVPKDTEKSFELYRQAAEQGHEVAQYNLGRLYHKGDGISKNLRQAVYWYEKAAEQGNVSSQFYLGVCCEQGNGVLQSYEQAVKWYKLAAEGGDAAAQLNLGICYQKAEGVSKNIEEAAKWFRKAAEQGLAPAQFNLGVCYDKGEGISKNLELAVYWYEKAAQQGHTSAQFCLGSCYLRGEGVSKNLEKAVEYYTKAAEQGNPMAQYGLGLFYYFGHGVDESKEQAAIWLTKAAEQGNTKAQYHLGLCYILGNGVTQNYEQAVVWYTKAAEQGDSLAQFNLGRCYEKGIGVLQSYEQAAKWLTKAAEQGNKSAIKLLQRLSSSL